MGADIPPPPRRLNSARVEALRAAAKVHQGIGLYDGAEPGVSHPTVLETAEAFEAWLTEATP